MSHVHNFNHWYVTELAWRCACGEKLPLSEAANSASRVPDPLIVSPTHQDVLYGTQPTTPEVAWHEPRDSAQDPPHAAGGVSGEQAWREACHNANGPFLLSGRILNALTGHDRGEAEALYSVSMDRDGLLIIIGFTR